MHLLHPVLTSNLLCLLTDSTCRRNGCYATLETQTRVAMPSMEVGVERALGRVVVCARYDYMPSLHLVLISYPARLLMGGTRRLDRCHATVRTCTHARSHAIWGSCDKANNSRFFFLQSMTAWTCSGLFSPWITTLGDLIDVMQHLEYVHTRSEHLMYNRDTYELER